MTQMENLISFRNHLSRNPDHFDMILAFFYFIFLGIAREADQGRQVYVTKHYNNQTISKH